MEQLMAASIEAHCAVEKKHRKGKKTHTVHFLEIDLLYPDHTEVINLTYKPKKSYENRKHAKAGGCNSNRRPDRYRNVQWNPHEVLSFGSSGL